MTSNAMNNNSLFLLITITVACFLSACGDGPVEVVEPDHRPTPPVNVLETGPTPSIQVALLHQNHDISAAAEEQVDRVKAMVNDTVQKKTVQDRNIVDVNSSAAKAIADNSSSISASTKKLHIENEKTTNTSGGADKSTLAFRARGASSNAGSAPQSLTNVESISQTTQQQSSTEEDTKTSKPRERDPLIIDFANAGRGANDSRRHGLSTDGIDSSNAVREVGPFGVKVDPTNGASAPETELSDLELENYLKKNRNSDLFGIIHHRYRIIGLEWESDRATEELKAEAGTRQ